MDDASIVELYWNRDERAIKETESKYGKLCFGLANNMLSNLQDAEECVSDTYLAAWNSIPPARPFSFMNFLCKITKNLALKKIEYSHAAKRNKNMTASFNELSECLSGKSSPEDELNLKELSAAISRFLHTQKEREQAVFVKRYWFYAPIPDIAKEFKISERNVSLILFRQRQRLKDYLEKEGFDL